MKEVAMPWKEQTLMSLRVQFVQSLLEGDSSLSQLCRQFGISRKTAYKWIARFREGGWSALADRSKRPIHSPTRTEDSTEDAVLRVRDLHKAWGARKIASFLSNQGFHQLPAPSTITAILRRHGRIDPSQSSKHKPFIRFCMQSPNQLWQMDFKGHFMLGDGQSCHPLTILDDHSRFLLALRACPNETRITVEQELTRTFRLFGIPGRMLMDNGSPWGGTSQTPHTKLVVWLMHIGIAVSHGRPFHPQTQGKDERLHRTISEELLRGRSFRNLQECQEAFDLWREVYNTQRPHEAIGMRTPECMYEPSSRAFPEVLPAIVYEEGEQVRKVDKTGKVYFRNRAFRVGKGFAGYLVGIRPGEEEGIFEVVFGTQKVGVIELAKGV